MTLFVSLCGAFIDKTYFAYVRLLQKLLSNHMCGIVIGWKCGQKIKQRASRTTRSSVVGWTQYSEIKFEKIQPTRSRNLFWNRFFKKSDECKLCFSLVTFVKASNIKVLWFEDFRRKLSTWIFFRIKNHISEKNINKNCRNRTIYWRKV